MSTGAPLNLTLEPSGTKGWTNAVNGNFIALNTAIAALQAGGTTGPAGAVGPAGPIGMNYRGGWLSTTNYFSTDVVTINGSAYIAIQASINQQPDLNPYTWKLLAAAGAPGPAGPTGPQGPQGVGGGAAVAYPITVAQGGTGAITAALARFALGAAASGSNSDITGLTDLTAAPALGAFGTAAINIQSTGGNGQAILITDNAGHTGGVTTQGDAYFSTLSMPGGILCGGGQFASGILTNQISNATPGQPLGIPASVAIGGALTIAGATPTAAAGQIGIGTDTSSTATAGGGATVPATVLGFLKMNIGGTVVKFPYFAN